MQLELFDQPKQQCFAKAKEDCTSGMNVTTLTILKLPSDTCMVSLFLRREK